MQYKNEIPVISCRFKFCAISLLELRNIKKKNNYRRISSNLILDNWDLVGNILLEIINKSLETGIFPDNYKESMITAIEKIKNTNECEEFRPINSLKTAAVGKLLGGKQIIFKISVWFQKEIL